MKKKELLFLSENSNGVHQGKGVQPVHQEEEDSIRKNSSEWLKLWENTKSIMIHYVHNLF